MVPTTYKKGSLDRKIGQGSPFYIDSSCFPAYSFHRNITICALVHLLPTPNRSLPIPSAMLSCAAPCHSGCVVGIRCDITEPGTATCGGAAHRKVKSLSTPLHPWLRPSQHKRILLRTSRSDPLYFAQRAQPSRLTAYLYYLDAIRATVFREQLIE